ALQGFTFLQRLGAGLVPWRTGFIVFLRNCFAVSLLQSLAGLIPIEPDRVMHPASGSICHIKPNTYTYTLDGLTAHEPLRQTSINFFVPVHGATQAHGHSQGNHLIDATYGIAVFFGLINFSLHLGFHLGAGNTQFAAFHSVHNLLVSKAAGIYLYTTKIYHVAIYGNSQLCQQATTQGSYAYTRGGFARAGSPKNVTGVGMVKLYGTREI